MCGSFGENAGDIDDIDKKVKDLRKTVREYRLF